ncbi:MAG: hypothetical protein M3552_13340 [Planctomycetota bacterium]|nr:hypothetical protein [Planctomycetaceae bacterium]MDQ3331617.1 hypothetical protein [Planctomycetota bacterium]
MLQTMENAWLRMKLDEHLAHPLNSGWVNALHRWTTSASFRRYWPTLRGEYSEQFVRFCEREFGLSIRPVIVAIDRKRESDGNELDLLRRDFEREWPQETWPLFPRRIPSVVRNVGGRSGAIALQRSTRYGGGGGHGLVRRLAAAR